MTRFLGRVFGTFLSVAAVVAGFTAALAPHSTVTTRGVAVCLAAAVAVVGAKIVRTARKEPASRYPGYRRS